MDPEIEVPREQQPLTAEEREDSGFLFDGRTFIEVEHSQRHLLTLWPPKPIIFACPHKILTRKARKSGLIWTFNPFRLPSRSDSFESRLPTPTTHEFSDIMKL